MTLQAKKEALISLGQYINTEDFSEIKHKANIQNPWFTLENIDLALTNIANQFLAKSALESLIEKYKLDDHLPQQKVGLVLAGNIPLVGFHDILMCFICNKICLIKYSEKDNVLIPHLLEKLIEFNPKAAAYFVKVERLTDFDAVIATGSNSAAHHFEHYFKNVPHIIRKNRNAIAILSGTETDAELDNLAHDIFDFFGLGCRNVSKLYLPKDYDFTRLFAVLKTYSELLNHNKYKNNYDYNCALYLINKEPFLQHEVILFRPATSIMSRIGCIHFEYYLNVKKVFNAIKNKSEEIQCVVSNIKNKEVSTTPFGQAQSPTIDTFADDVDTVQFLLTL